MIGELIHNLLEWNVGDTKIAVVASLVAMSCAVPGVWLVLRQHSMMGDALAHTALPGVVIAFLIAHWLGKDQGGPVALHGVLVVGAVVVGVLTAVVTELVQKLGRMESGTSLGVVFTSFFALGLFLLVWQANSVHIDPECVLFGMLEFVPWQQGIPREALINGGVLLVNLALMVLFYKELKISAFDPALATSQGIGAGWMHYGLMVATALTVVAAFETVGSILVIGLLIAPAATAYLLTNRLNVMILLSLVIAAGSGFLGHALAKTVPAVIFPRLGFDRVEDVRTSGMVAVAAGLLFVGAWLFSPQHGLLRTLVSRARLAVRIAGDDLLGLLYRVEERNLKQAARVAPALVAERMGLGVVLTRLTVWSLMRRRLINHETDGYHLTSAGRDAARTLVRAHRLWESYLQKHFALPDDHLHAPAHRVEHYIDASVSEQLSSELNVPAHDPHGREIPRDGREE